MSEPVSVVLEMIGVALLVVFIGLSAGWVWAILPASLYLLVIANAPTSPRRRKPEPAADEPPALPEPGSEVAR